MIMLLASVGPLFVVISNFDSDDDTTEDEVPEAPVIDESTGDLLDLVDFEARPDEARAAVTGPEAFEATRGTDAAAEFEGDDALRNIHDASGGNDALTGGALDDVLIGGEASDTISGGEGNDDLFGGFQRASRADDLDADTLDGGAGDDSLFLGNGDIGFGGAGADAFILVQDTTGSVVIEDFDPQEDAILVEDPEPATLDFEEQAVVEGNLVITLTTGATITLNGVSAALAENSVLFVDVEATDLPTTA